MTRSQLLFSVCCLLAMRSSVTGIPVLPKDPVDDNFTTALETVTAIAPVSLEPALLKDGEDEDTIDDTEFEPILSAQENNTDVNISDGKFKPVVVGELRHSSSDSKGNVSSKKLKVESSAKDLNESIVLGDQPEEDTLKELDLEPLDRDETDQTVRDKPTTEPIVSENDEDSERSMESDFVTRGSNEESTAVPDVDDDSFQEDENEDNVVLDEDPEKGTSSKVIGNSNGPENTTLTTIPHFVIDDSEGINGTVTSSLIGNNETATLNAANNDNVSNSAVATSISADNADDVNSEALTSAPTTVRDETEIDMATTVPVNNEDNINVEGSPSIPSHDEDNINIEATSPMLSENADEINSDATVSSPGNNANDIKNAPTTKIPVKDDQVTSDPADNQNEDQNTDQDTENSLNGEVDESDDSILVDEALDEEV